MSTLRAMLRRVSSRRHQPWILGAGLLWTQPGHAQPCHRPSAVDPTELGAHVSLAGQAASFDTRRYSGEYQGLSLAVGWQRQTFALEARMPAFRIVRNGLEDSGLGDLSLAARVPLLRSRDEAHAAGVGLATTLPTGDASADLGMGHVMLMPEVWYRWDGPVVFSELGLMYGRALGSHGSAHHAGGPRPIVDPMNASEAGGTIAGGLRLGELLRTRAGAYGAAPLNGDGVARAAVFLSVDASLGFSFAGIEAHLPLAGAPFTRKLGVTIGARL